MAAATLPARERGVAALAAAPPALADAEALPPPNTPAAQPRAPFTAPLTVPTIDCLPVAEAEAGLAAVAAALPTAPLAEAAAGGSSIRRGRGGALPATADAESLGGRGDTATTDASASAEPADAAPPAAAVLAGAVEAPLAGLPADAEGPPFASTFAALAAAFAAAFAAFASRAAAAASDGFNFPRSALRAPLLVCVLVSEATLRPSRSNTAQPLPVLLPLSPAPLAAAAPGLLPRARSPPPASCGSARGQHSPAALRAVRPTAAAHASSRGRWHSAHHSCGLTAMPCSHRRQGVTSAPQARRLQMRTGRATLPAATFSVKPEHRPQAEHSLMRARQAECGSSALMSTPAASGDPL